MCGPTPLILGINFPLNTSQPPHILIKPSKNFTIPNIPPSYESTPPNSHIIIFDRPSPPKFLKDPIRTIIDLEAWDKLSHLLRK